MSSKPLIKSHVWHDNRLFFVSTINQLSSAAAPYGAMYAETLAWECDPETMTRRAEIIAQASSAFGSASGHYRICDELLWHGKVEERDE